MKYIKLQQDLLKEMDSWKSMRGFFWHEDEFVYYSDGFKAMAVPENCWYLSDDALGKHLQKYEGKLSKLYDGKDREYLPAQMTGNIKVANGDELVEIASEKCTAYVNKKQLKYFENPTFTLKSPVSPLGVFESFFVGIVLPTRIKKAGE